MRLGIFSPTRIITGMILTAFVIGMILTTFVIGVEQSKWD